MSSNQLASGNSTKAGLPTTSLDEINSRIFEASKDSRFTVAQERKNVELKAKLQTQKEQLERALKQAELVIKAKRMVDSLTKEYEKEQAEQLQNFEEYCWVCVDMDAFYASVECLDAPELKDIPMAVGSSSMLSTSNYAARKYGVSAAMPGYIAQKLCPDLVIVPLRFDRYREMSGKVADVLIKYDANLSMWSLDEAFLRLTKGGIVTRNFENYSFSFFEIVQKMRDEVKEKTGLTCSAGIACNPLLAKMASNLRKPDGQYEINRQDQKSLRNFLSDQPVRKLSGLGKVMSATLENVFGVRTVGELYDKRHFLPLIFKEKTVKSLVSKCIGHSDDTVMTATGNDTNEFGQKSLSCERTFQASEVDLPGLFNEITESLLTDLQSMLSIIRIGRVGIKVKSADFKVFTREKRVNLVGPFSGTSILREAVSLFKDFIDTEEEMEIRLLGVRLSSFSHASPTEEKKRSAASVMETWLDDSIAKCPICLTVVFKDEKDLVEVNGHIDDCLSKSALKEIISKECEQNF